jgi:hypothetical protein
MILHYVWGTFKTCLQVTIFVVLQLDMNKAYPLISKNKIETVKSTCQFNKTGFVSSYSKHLENTKDSNVFVSSTERVNL